MQEEAHRLRTKEIHINDLLQPYQEKITELVDTVEQNVREFTTTKEETDATEMPVLVKICLTQHESMSKQCKRKS